MDYQCEMVYVGSVYYRYLRFFWGKQLEIAIIRS
jgi:hypothetical protein